MGWTDYIPLLGKKATAPEPKLKICCACPETKVQRASSHGKIRSVYLCTHSREVHRCPDLRVLHRAVRSAS